MIALSSPTHIDQEGFTLTELLVSITIVVLLAGLLFPAVGSMLRRGKEAGSISNLQNIGQGVSSYVAEHNGRYPAGYYGAAKSPFWCEEVTAYLSPVADTNRFQNAQARAFIVSEKMLDPMLKNGRHNRLGDYGGNIEIFRSPDDAPSYGTAQPPLAVGAISQPSQKIMVVPTEQTYTDGDMIGSWILSTYLYVNQGSNAATSQALPSDRGTKRVQSLFADGHIEAIPKDVLIQNRRTYFLLNP